MRALKTLFKIIGIGVLGVALLIAGALAFLKYKNTHYYKFTKVDEPLEQRYTALGEQDVSFAEFEAGGEDSRKYEIWYPSRLESGSETYPVVIIANGTGVPASSYSAFFKHLASWGFIAVGNEDGNSRTGESSEASLQFLLEQNENDKSIFHGKVDTRHIGIGGHSQGGVGAINAVTSQAHGNLYKALYAVSATSPYWGQKNVFGTDWGYNLSKIRIPTFLAAGTGAFDAGTATDIEASEGQGISPLWALRANYASIPDSVFKVAARKKEVDHGETYQAFDGYMTAWFRWHLSGDSEAATVFKGSEAEILHNKQYQDTESNIR